MCWASAPGCSPAIVATTCRGRSEDSSAHSATAPLREVAAEPGRAPQHLVGLDVVTPAQLLQERPAQVLLDLQARLLDGDLGQAGHRGHVQELQRVGARARPRRAAARRRAARRRWRSAPPRRRPAARRPRGRAPARPRSGAAPTVSATGPEAAAAPRRGNDDRDHPAGLAGGELGHALEPVAAQHGIHHAQVHRSQPLHHGGPAVVRVGLHRHVQYASFCTRGGFCESRPAHPPSTSERLTRPPERRPRGGPAGSLRRTRPCESGRPPRRAG